MTKDYFPADHVGTLYCASCEEPFEAGSHLLEAPLSGPADPLWNACPYCEATDGLSEAESIA